MAKLKANNEFISDKTKNPVVSSEYVKHGTGWLKDTVDNLSTESAGKADQSYVEDNFALHSSRINAKASQTSVDAIEARVSTNETNIAANSARMDTFTTLTDGSTTGDAELADGRVGVDGTTYTNIGGAIRGQAADLNQNISISMVDIASEIEYANYNAAFSSSNNRVISRVLDIDNIKSISVSSGYQFCLFGKSGSYTMYWTGTNFARSNALYTDNLPDIQKIIKNSNVNSYRICVKKTNDGDLTQYDCMSNVHVYASVNKFTYDLSKNISELKKETVSIVQGNVDNAGNVHSEILTRVTTDFIFSEITDKYITVTGDYAIRNVNRYDRFKGFDAALNNGVNVDSYKLEKGYGYRITICKKSDINAEISPDSEISKNIHISDYVTYRSDKNYDVESVELRQGYIDNSGQYHSDLLTRVCTEIIYADSDVEIFVTGDYAIRNVDVFGMSANYVGKCLNGVNVKSFMLDKGKRYIVTFCKFSNIDETINPNILKSNVSVLKKNTIKSLNVDEIFKKYTSSGKQFNIKLVGDSILQGVGGSNFEQNGETIIKSGSTTWKRNPNGYCWGNLFKNLLESKYNCNVTNNGCRGTYTGFLIDNWDTLISPDDDLIICCYGTNDRAFTSNQRTFEANIRIIEQKAHDNGQDIIFISGIPAGLNNELCLTGNYEHIYYHMEDVDRLICEASRGKYISLFNEVQNWVTYTDIELTDYLDEYELHPNDELYWKIFVWICKSLNIAPKIKNSTW